MRDIDADSRSKCGTRRTLLWSGEHKLVGLRNSIPCHGVHDLIKNVSLGEPRQEQQLGVRVRVTPKESIIHEGGLSPVRGNKSNPESV